LGAVVVGGGGDESSGFDAAFAFERIEADKVEGDVLEEGQVVGSVMGTGAHLVIVEDHIQRFCGKCRFSTCPRSSSWLWTAPP
jgi:hypothetical protein